jgi:transporter family-2 protein
MTDARFLGLFGLGVLTGSMLAIQAVLNATLGKRVGILGSLVVLTVIALGITIILVVLYPTMSNLRNLPGRSEWYVYLGAVMGVAIMMAPIFLVPRIGATSTLTAFVMGQLLLALVIDHFGLLAAPKIELSVFRVVGVVLLIAGAYLISK